MDLITASRLGHLQTVENLLTANPESLQEPDQAGGTALHHAAYWGQKTVAQTLLRHGAQVNQPDALGRTPLHFMAGACTMVDLMQYLLDKGAQVQTRDNFGNSSLFITAQCIHEVTDWGYHHGVCQFLLDAGACHDIATAVILNAIEPLQELLKSQPASVKKGQQGGYLPDDTTPLHHACERGNHLATQRLLQAGANPNAVDSRGRPPLYLAAQLGGLRRQQPGVELIDLLFSYDISRDIFTAALLGDLHQLSHELAAYPDRALARDLGGQTPLHLAAWNGHTEAAKRLLAAGADPNAINHRGESPLQLATTYGHRETVEALLAKGALADIFTAVALGHIPHIEAQLAADPAQLNARNRYGETPFSWANWTDIRGFFADADTVREFLRTKGARLNLANAAALDDTQTIRGLLKNEPECIHHDHLALHAAAGQGHLNTLELLVESGASLEARDEACHRTPLFEAVFQRQQGAVEFLAGCGADCNARDNYGDTPLVHAADHGATQVVTTLLSLGADPNSADYLGGTSLHWAAMNGHAEIVELLLQNGADILSKGWGWWNDGKTAQDLAQEHNQPAIARLFDDLAS
ncbi:MAG: hypothetical protein GKR89_16225 [Candidatus Latescibacteria bacterium]|nr:hypothetical protein [Candidatus Latescibacterota bacterium]